MPRPGAAASRAARYGSRRRFRITGSSAFADDDRGGGSLMNANLAAILYLVAGVLFILSLRGLSSPASSRRHRLDRTEGLRIAVATTLAAHPPADGLGWVLVVLGGEDVRSLRLADVGVVQDLSMPELVAAFHSL